MFIKKPKYHKFDYQPRYYDPDKDPELRRKRKLGFRSNRPNYSKRKSPVVFVLLLIVIVYLLLKYQGLI